MIERKMARGPGLRGPREIALLGQPLSYGQSNHQIQYAQHNERPSPVDVLRRDSREETSTESADDRATDVGCHGRTDFGWRPFFVDVRDGDHENPRSKNSLQKTPEDQLVQIE